jgi:hypothetical protein
MRCHASPNGSEPSAERVARRRSQYSAELGRPRLPSPSRSNALTRQAAARFRIPPAAKKTPADTLVLMSRPSTGEWALPGRLGAVAGSLRNGETASLYAKYGVPLRFSGMAATTPVGAKS